MVDNIDYTGARGSNAGDKFHVLWALRQMLLLLDHQTQVKGIGVEGVSTAIPGDESSWEGVDVAIYYGGIALESTKQIDLVQLKYSSAYPDSKWTVAKLTSSKSKKINNSVFRKMATAFSAASKKVSLNAAVNILLVSNQAVSDDLKILLETKKSGGLLTTEQNEGLKKLQIASGLSDSDFLGFISKFDVTQCGRGSIFDLQEKVVVLMNEILGDDVSSEARELETRVRDLMLPQSSGKIVQERDLLIWLGVGSREALFPCEPEIKPISNPVARQSATLAVEHLSKGQRVLLIHGEGGSGKTTLIRQIALKLPPHSIAIHFDCFGGGRYTFSDDKRHLAENAFLHLSNEISTALKLALFVPRSYKNPANIQMFMSKLKTAGLSLNSINPSALLVIVIDAADNSISAAKSANPVESSFVNDLVHANLKGLPNNVRFVFSTRTSRRDLIEFPPETVEINCPPFTIDETRAHLERYFSDINDVMVEQFHGLSLGNPRVQSYAIDAGRADRPALLNVLRPSGKNLSDVLQKTFENALKKNGQTSLFKNLIAALANLPAPASINAIAEVSGTTSETVKDLALDLMPGIRVQEDSILIADEDFEEFIKKFAEKEHESTMLKISDYFLENYLKDAYSSYHIADSLLSAKRAEKLVFILESDPHVSAVSDPIARRQIQVRRLRLSLASCRQTDSIVDTLKTITISAEAEKDDTILNELLEKELDLSIEFSGPALRRRILLDRDRASDQGKFLVHDAARASRIDDAVTTSDRLHFYNAWLEQRKKIPKNEQHEWDVSSGDLAARFEAIMNISSIEKAYDDISRWTPKTTPLEVAFVLIPKLVSQGKSAAIIDLLNSGKVPKPWDLVLCVALSVAGEQVDPHQLESSLKRLRGPLIPDPAKLKNYYAKDDWSAQLLDNFITSCELGYLKGIEPAVLQRAVDRILKVLVSPGRKFFRFDFIRFDALTRCWILREVLIGNEPKEHLFIQFLKSSSDSGKESESADSSLGNRRKSTSDDQEAESVLKKISALFEVYKSRQEIFTLSKENRVIDQSIIEKLGAPSQNSYALDHDYDGMDWRKCASVSVMMLLMVPELDPNQLINKASSLILGRFSDPFGSRRLTLWRMVRNRTSETEKLLKFVSTAQKEIQSAQSPASEKIDALIDLARLLLPVSLSDAGALFSSAISIAKEIDREAIDQIDLVSELSKFAILGSDSQQREVTSRIYNFITASSRRLSGREFTWKSPVAALSALNAPTGIAAVSMWADLGLAGLEETLEPLLVTMLRRKTVNSSTAVAFSALLDNSSLNLQRSIIKGWELEGQTHTKVIEKVAQNILLLNSQQDRIALGNELLEETSSLKFKEEYWFSTLKRTLEFHSKNVRPTLEERKTKEKLNSEIEYSVKEFKLSQVGPINSSKKMEEILNSSLVDGYPRHETEVLNAMMAASSAPKDRVPFLNALVETSEEAVWITNKVEILSKALLAWSNTPAVNQWCSERLPTVVSENFHGFAMFLKQGGNRLREILELCPADNSLRLTAILNGIAINGQRLGSRALYGVLEIASSLINPNELGEFLNWFSIRLSNRVPISEFDSEFINVVPITTRESISRFVFAQLSDLDTRIRWKAAHVIRSMALLGEHSLVAEVFGQKERVSDAAFRDPKAPYYFLAARLWLAIAIHRISSETPLVTIPFKDELFTIATSNSFPHLAVREYSKLSLFLLKDFNSKLLTPKEIAALDLVNFPERGEIDEQKVSRKRFDRNKDLNQRFNYNSVDTIPYWYQPLLGVFPGLDQQKFLGITDKWIVDEWKASLDAYRWDSEPRKERYDDRKYNLWNHSHGSLPVVERYATYLEWHAMHCAAGELLRSAPISDCGDDYGGLAYWKKHFMPTDPPEWLSDKRTATPLEVRFWTENLVDEEQWLKSIHDSEFLQEIFPSETAYGEWLVVAGNYSISSEKRESNISIESGIAPTKTVHELIGILQAADPYEFGWPDEDENFEFGDKKYDLSGWLARFSEENEFDERDPFRYEVQWLGAKPGKDLVKFGKLKSEKVIEQLWFSKERGTPLFRLEIWCDEPLRDRDYIRGVKSNGWRLSGDKNFIQAFLNFKSQDLLCEVKIVRRIHNEFRRRHDEEKREIHTKILCFGKDGILKDSEKRIGSWSGSIKKSQSYSRRAYSGRKKSKNNKVTKKNLTKRNKKRVLSKKKND